MEITVRHAEPDDIEAIHRILSGPRAMAGTLQLPLQLPLQWLEGVRKRDEKIKALRIYLPMDVALEQLGAAASPEQRVEPSH